MSASGGGGRDNPHDRNNRNHREAKFSSAPVDGNGAPGPGELGSARSSLGLHCRLWEDLTRGLEWTPVRNALLVVMVLTLSPSLRASLWDDETLAADAQGLPDIVRIVTGRFERDPPLYYEMRLSRAAAQIKAQPNNLAAYDIAGVACDRLGRGDEAIAWMELKNLQQELMVRSGTRTAEDLRDHEHRCLANIGTFWFHRWARAGADRSRREQVTTALEMIAKAIALYPHTHFDRERYQLRMLERIVSAPEYTSGRLPPLLDFTNPTNRSVAAVRALAALIVLGNEQESVDLYNTLAQALDHVDPRSSVADLARLRCHELITAGRRSLLPGAPTEARALSLAIDPLARPGAGGAPPADQPVRIAYRRLRDEAEACQSARNAFMTRRLEEGRHPNTNPDFWKGYREAPPPAIVLPELPAPGHARRERAARRLQGLLVAFVAGTALSALMAWITLRNTRFDLGGGEESRPSDDVLLQPEIEGSPVGRCH
jgi:hypothetical protein